MENTTTAQHRAYVIEVHSGDDLVLLVDLGIEGLYRKVRARLYGVDTPDAYKTNQKTEAGKVRAFVQELTLLKKCTIDVHAKGGGGGWIVSLYIGNKHKYSLNQTLRDKGYVFKGQS